MNKNRSMCLCLPKKCNGLGKGKKIVFLIQL